MVSTECVPLSHHRIQNVSQTVINGNQLYYSEGFHLTGKDHPHSGGGVVCLTHSLPLYVVILSKKYLPKQHLDGRLSNSWAQPGRHRKLTHKDLGEKSQLSMKENVAVVLHVARDRGTRDLMAVSTPRNP